MSMNWREERTFWNLFSRTFAQSLISFKAPGLLISCLYGETRPLAQTDLECCKLWYLYGMLVCWTGREPTHGVSERGHAAHHNSLCLLSPVLETVDPVATRYEKMTPGTAVWGGGVVVTAAN